ncbi:uncharacterized protein At2g39795, mitochondrial [Rhododendron vialii]|uniref:uncharacterized protein At2g39795, mitochondrial n=1 Tax=Rhododendron vialii TaxID=182163 RepID=UPI00265DEA9E|nr:uncharacterized protein At2g39795, mitochondrial [Rhododendron vialii]
MPRISSVLRKGRKAIQELDLLKVLQSEIRHEDSSNPFQDSKSASLGDFKLDWDSPHSQDVVLRKKCESGEEVAVSALLGPRTYGEEDAEDKESIFPREALMKVCIKKPGLSSILQFDCGVSGSNVGDWSSVYINSLHYLPSTSLDCSIYKSPSYRHEELDPDLRIEIKTYLESKGIEESLTNFLLLHLHRKEQGQYVHWLRKLEEMVTQGDDGQTNAGLDVT